LKDDLLKFLNITKSLSSKDSTYFDDKNHKSFLLEKSVFDLDEKHSFQKKQPYGKRFFNFTDQHFCFDKI
jgi:hypothetical protein